MKKQFLTLALLATVAIGGAFAGQNKTDETYPFAGLLNNNDNFECLVQVPCSPIPGPPCILSSNQYYGNDFDKAKCNIFLSRDINE